MSKLDMRCRLRETRGLGIPLPLRARFIRAALRSDWDNMRALGAEVQDGPQFYCGTCGDNISITRYVLRGRSGAVGFDFGHVGPEMWVRRNAA